MAIFNSKIKSLQIANRGKVRDIYNIDNSRILIVTTDRISAFDQIAPNPVPDKGIILNKLSVFWMERFSKIISNHLTGESPESFVDKSEISEVYDRAVVAKKLNPVPIEAVVRGFITGSAWNEYTKNDCKVCGIKLPQGLHEGNKLETPIFTPASKASLGNHDENISFEDAKKLVGSELMEQIKAVSLNLYKEAYNLLIKKNITLVDTKFEFGLNSNNELILIDEVLTPDSSRYLFRDSSLPQKKFDNLDKQFVRDYLLETGWDEKSNLPTLPKKIVFQLSNRYRKVFSLITGKQRPKVSVVMGSESDWQIMSFAVEIFKEFDIACEFKVLSAHRMPDDLYEFAEDASFRGIRGIVAGAGGAAHLPGMLAAKTTVPIFGVPITSKHLNGEDSLYSIVQMPKGVPVATFAIGKPGAINAALHVVSTFSVTDDSLREKLDLYREKQTKMAKSMNLNLGGS